jgi:Skp family chaperone for outer membrane proteins
MNLLRTTILTVVLLAALSVSAAEQTRIATVDLPKLFEGYWKTKQVQTMLNERKAQLDNDDRGMRDDYKKASDEYQKLLIQANDQALSPEQRDKRKQAAADKLKQLQDSKTAIDQFERQAQITLTEQGQRMRDNILAEIKAAATAQAKSGGYTLVVDIAAITPSGTTMVLYSTSENDLTDAVLKRLNAGRTDTTAPVVSSPSSLLGTNASRVNSR